MKAARNITLLKWHAFGVDFSLWAPLAIIYFAKVSGSYTLGLAVFSVTMLSAAIWELPTGIFSDYFGRKMTLVAGSAAYMISVAAYAVSGGFGGLLVGAVLEGLGRAFYSGNNESLVYDNLAAEGKEGEYAEHSGKIGAMGQWAAAISAALASLTAFFSLQLMIWLSIIPQIVCLVLAMAVNESQKISPIEGNIFAHTKEAAKLFKNNFKLRWLSIASIVEYGISESSYQFQSAFVALLWPVWAIGFARVLSSVGAAVSFRYAGKFIKRFKAINILLFDNVYSRVTNLWALIFVSWLSPLLMTTSSLLFGVSTVAESALMQEQFSTKKRATMGSLNSLGGKIFFAIFAVTLGKAADSFGPAKALIGAQVLTFGVTIIYWRLFRSGENSARI